MDGRESNPYTLGLAKRYSRGVHAFRLTVRNSVSDTSPSPLHSHRREETSEKRMVKLTVRERESIQEAVRRFRKLVERSGIKKEMRRREFFEKPSETRRRARLRAERRTKRNRLLGV